VGGENVQGDKITVSNSTVGDYAGARPLYERALAIFEKVLGKEHPNTKVVRGNLERLLAEMQQPPE
jgi:hypothetical protein